MKNSEKIKIFPPQTAGRLMTSQVPLVLKQQTIREVQNLFFERLR